MRFSLWTSTEPAWPDLLERASAAEAAGFDGVWVADHFMPNGTDVSSPMLECFTTLAGLAAAVPRVRLGSLVAGNTYRHPAVLANIGATIDHVSGGRFVLGVGAGWQENEHAAYGIELPSRRERIDRFEEACEVIASLRDRPRTDFAGTRYQLTDAPMEPKPLGPMPLLIGSSGPKRMPPIVARWADEWNSWGTPEVFADKVAHIDRACDEAGRDPASLQRSTQALVFLGPDGAAKAAELQAIRPAIGGTAEQLLEVVEQYRAAGVDELIFPDFTFGSGQSEVLEVIDQLAREVVAVAR
ncbi:TIGR03560 family F420-dependent LLM class oxidoreductase [Aquihabitans sp. G128]|uniref:TIGR03560 family F420-dependent LLM class oxidoreductase n=1 Tax=Aquihabitans sp. G128 TaxID=2849779 RepID=UPI001C21158A|nr:TIGR03560 family F420-dependent LLM class oxidoreductase [Aquihabitans sp. G128]QXC62781.1 TIGR03560 family F420-dependent LLM class oxidoreductase [Aquihabitans sp. G128]